MNRREALFSIAGGVSACLFGSPVHPVRWRPLGLSHGAKTHASQPTKQTRLGICIHSFPIRSRVKKLGGGKPTFGEPSSFLEYCHQLGAGGIQVELGIKDETYTSKLRRQAEGHDMFVEGMAVLPRNRADVERFEGNVRTAKRAGAKVVRVVMIPGRRYEGFDSAEQFRESARQGWESLQLAEPVAARHRIRLAVENHKDHRVDEKLDIIRRLSSEYVGVCVDTGNSIALLEDPMEVVKAYAPCAFSVHLKDMAVREYEEGFLLSEVPLGEGFLDLSQMVKVLRQAHPEINFGLEMITRDPLRVPCLTDKYWATFSDVPGKDLARTLSMVRDQASGRPLPRVSGLSFEQQLRLEDDNIRKCLAFAREHLRL